MRDVASRAPAACPRVLARGACLAALGCLFVPTAEAQFGEQPVPQDGITVPLHIDSHDEFLRSAADDSHYAPMLDMRRRILANTYAWGAELAGPSNSDLSLSEDACREDGAGPVDGTCTPVPAEDVDRLAVAWADTSTFVPEDSVVHNEFNHPTMRETLWLPSDGVNALHNPGLWFRFLSGPAALYDVEPPWSTLSPVPTSESTGFEVESIRLLAGPDQVRSTTGPSTLRAYERAMIVLLGAEENTEDSVTFRLDPAVKLPTLAAWTNGSGSAWLYFECGMPPNPLSSSMAVAPWGDVRDLTQSSCETGWYVTAVNTQTVPVVVNVKVGALAGTNRIFDLVVGLEYEATATEIGFVRRVMREAAWRFYGLTGGSHLIATFTYLEPPNCGGAHICWRNTTACTQGAAKTHPSGSTPSITVDICRDLTGRSAADNPGVDERSMAHEFGHLLTANGTLNQLGDEYWQSNFAAGICGETGVFIQRCGHSIMANTREWMASLCTSRTHDAATQVQQQLGGGAYTTIGMRSEGWSQPTTTVSECLDGTTNFAGTHGSAAWSVLANTGAAPVAHPDWSPDNHDFENFANGGSTVVGHNL